MVPDIGASESISPEALCYFSWPQYCLESTYLGNFKAESIGINPPGVRWGMWPFYFEAYYSETEPSLSYNPGPTRLILWHRVHRCDVPSGWIRSWFKRRGLFNAYTLLEPEYFKHWTTSARHRRSYWQRNLQNKEYDIEPVDFQTFAEAYRYSTVAEESPDTELDKLKVRLKRYPQHVDVWAVRRKSDGKVLAGLASVSAPEYKSTYYACSFYLKEAKQHGLVVALIDHWFSVSLARGIRILHMGVCSPQSRWYPNRARAISDFKMQFTTHTLHFDTLFRLKLGSFFR